MCCHTPGVKKSYTPAGVYDFFTPRFVVQTSYITPTWGFSDTLLGLRPPSVYISPPVTYWYIDSACQPNFMFAAL